MLNPIYVLVGQVPVKPVLMLAAIQPEFGGVMIRASKGDAKSTRIRDGVPCSLT